MMSTNYDKNSSASILHTIRIYCVRLKDIKDDFKLKADFGNNTMLTFDEEYPIHSKDALTPFIYMLQLNGKIDDSKRLQIGIKDGFKFIENYRLIISRPRPVTVYPKIYYQEKIDQNHDLPENFENPSDCFLFDTQFSKGMMFEPPGINTNCFDDLCLFTYYLVNKQLSHIFDSLARQFQINLANNNRKFSRENYHEFFKTCRTYMDSLLSVLETDVEALKTLVRMVGLLPIELENFERYNEHANSFAMEILRHIRPQFNRLFKSVNEPEQTLFRNGLAILLCIELLYPAEDNSNDNKLIFLSQIPDINQRQTIANEILLKLYKFNLPIYTNSTWTDLFTFIDPNMIKLQDIYIFDHEIR